MAKVEKSWSWDDDSDSATDYERIGEVEWDDEPYQFDLTRVYQKVSTGELFYATDFGCSCPTPFEDTEDKDLTPITRMQDWYDHVTKRTVYDDPDEEYQYPRPTSARTVEQIHRLAQKVNQELRKNK